MRCQHLIDSLLRSNDAHKHKMFEITAHGLPERARILMVGLAFKADTDDLRESPNVDLARMLLEAGYDLSIFDPAVNGAHLVGANLGYVYARIPQIDRLLVSKDVAEQSTFDRVIVCNGTASRLDLSNHPVLDLSRM
jgi:GDP-mannose 6-dehydrogenase